jgi:hypothetical protein
MARCTTPVQPLTDRASSTTLPEPRMLLVPTIDPPSSSLEQARQVIAAKNKSDPVCVENLMTPPVVA